MFWACPLAVRAAQEGEGLGFCEILTLQHCIKNTAQVIRKPKIPSSIRGGEAAKMLGAKSYHMYEEIATTVQDTTLQ